MRIYLRDTNDEIQETLDEGDYYAPKLHRFLQGKACVFSFSLIKNKESYELITAGKKLSFKYKDEDFWLNIITVDQDETTMEIQAWSLNLELNNEQSGPYNSEGAKTFDEYLAIFDPERTLTLGVNEVADKKISNEWTGTDTILARLFSLANVFDAELEFISELNDDGSLKAIVLNVYREYDETHHGMGADRTNETFHFGEDIKTIRKTEDVSELYTAIVPTGKDGLTLHGFPDKTEYDADGNIEFYTGFGNIYAKQARDRFPSASGREGYAAYIWETEYTTQTALYGAALAMLKKLSVPQVTWEIEGKVDGNIGDTVRIADDGYKPTLYLEARISEQEIDPLNEANTRTTFSNVEVKKSEVSSDLLDQVQKLLDANKTYQYSISTDNGIVFKNNTGTTTLTATVRDGVADVTANFAIAWFKDGEAIGRSKSVTVSASEVDEKAVYRFEAVKADGTVVGGYEVTVSDVSDGESGEPGRGIDGDPETTFAKSTNGTTPPSIWVADRPEVPAGQFLWTKTTTRYTDDTESSTIIPTLMGPKGEAGNGIKSTKTEYQASTSGTTPPTGVWTTGIPNVSANQYLWTRVVLTFTDDTTATFHSVGKMGANGSASYFHTAWADNETGTEGFSLTESLGKKYIGTYADNTQAGSTDPTKYNWVELANAIDLHTAYKMADGTFAKSEPGENLLDNSLSLENSETMSVVAWKNGTSTVDKSDGVMHAIVGTEVSQTGWSILYKPGTVPKNTKYSFGIDVKGTGRIRLTYKVTAQDGTVLVNWPVLDSFALTSDYKRLKGSFTTPNHDSIKDIQFAFYPQDGGTESWQTKPKLEIDSASIYTPAPSEDWANAIPKYVGTCTKDSDEPDDYTWTLNPEWVQMSSDKGLEDKLGNDQYMDDKGEIWTEIGNKVSQEEANEIRDMANSIESSLSAFLDDGGQYESDLASLEARTQGLVEQLGDQLATYEFLKTYISLGEEGLVIGSHDSTLKVLLSNGQLAFVDGGQTVAYFASQKFYINSGAVVESLQIGYHKITSLDKDNTVIQFIQS